MATVYEAINNSCIGGSVEERNKRYLEMLMIVTSAVLSTCIALEKDVEKKTGVVLGPVEKFAVHDVVVKALSMHMTEADIAEGRVLSDNMFGIVQGIGNKLSSFIK